MGGDAGEARWERWVVTPERHAGTGLQRAVIGGFILRAVWRCPHLGAQRSDSVLQEMRGPEAGDCSDFWVRELLSWEQAWRQKEVSIILTFKYTYVMSHQPISPSKSIRLLPHVSKYLLLFLP